MAAPALSFVGSYPLSSGRPSQAAVPLGAETDDRRFYVMAAVSGAAPLQLHLGDLRLIEVGSGEVADGLSWRIWTGRPAGATGGWSVWEKYRT